MGSLINVLVAIILVALSWGGEIIVLACLYGVYINLVEIPPLFALIITVILVATAILLILPTVYAGKTIIEFFIGIYNKRSGKCTDFWKP